MRLHKGLLVRAQLGFSREARLLALVLSECLSSVIQVQIP